MVSISCGVGQISLRKTGLPDLSEPSGSFTGTNNLISTNAIGYQTGPLGTFYQPTNSYLINTGSVTASVLALNHFTILTNQVRVAAKELVGGWALMECRDKAEAIEWTKRFLSVLGEGESRIRPVI